MESDRYGACGQAYRLWVADSPEQLAAGRYIYDSGKVLSGESVGVVYQGKALQPSTRYYWKVSVWDESGTEITSTEPAWFETGLLGSGWSGARWIGSSETQLSKYRSHYVIDYDVRVAEGNDKAAFVFGARDADNYVSAELDLNGSGTPVSFYAIPRMEKRRKTPRRVWPPSSRPRISIRRIISG